jgi:hypothetical protein
MPFQWIASVELDDGSLLPLLQPEFARHPTVALVHFPAQTSFHQIGRLVPIPVVKLGHPNPPEFKHIAKPSGGD